MSRGLDQVRTGAMKTSSKGAVKWRELEMQKALSMVITWNTYMVRFTF